MKIVEKCSAFVSLSYKAHVKVCNPIPLTIYIQCTTLEKITKTCLPSPANPGGGLRGISRDKTDFILLLGTLEPLFLPL